MRRCSRSLDWWYSEISSRHYCMTFHFIAMVIYLFCCWFKFIISIKIQMVFFVFKTVHSRRNTSFPKTNQTNQGNEHSKKTPLILIQKWWIYHYHRNNFHIVNLDINRKLWRHYAHISRLYFNYWLKSFRSSNRINDNLLRERPLFASSLPFALSSLWYNHINSNQDTQMAFIMNSKPFISDTRAK